jgi:hypothetical protein
MNSPRLPFATVVLAAAVAVLHLGGLLPHVPARGQDPSPPFRDEKTGLEYTDVPGFERLDVHRFEQAGLGYSIDYRAAGGVRVSLYVFDFGLKEIPDGPFSPVARQVFDQAKGDIRRAKEQGIYQDAVELSNEVVLLGDDAEGPLLRKATFQLRRNDADHVSYIYVTGHKNHFFKVRVTLPADDQAAHEKLAARLLTRVGEMLKPVGPPAK